MKKLFIFLFFISTALSANSQDEKIYYKWSELVVLDVVAQVGGSKLLNIQFPVCNNPTVGVCSDFSPSVIFNCNTNDIYTLGIQSRKINGEGNLNDLFVPVSYMSPAIAKFKNHCSKKPQLSRANVLIANSSKSEAFFLISDTLKKEDGILKAWVEITEFFEQLDPVLKNIPEDEIESWMYIKTAKPNSKLTKIYSHYNCAKQSIKPVRVINFDSSGAVEEDIDSKDSAFYPVVPGSVGEIMLKNICALY